MSSPDQSLQACTGQLNHSKIIVKRDGRRATFINAERTFIKCVDLDAWLSGSGTARADYILAKPQIADVIIELKGKDITWSLPA